MSEHNHTGLDEAASVASNTMQAVRTGKAISAAAKGAAAGGPYGAAIGAALSARKHIGKIAAAALVLLALPLLFILLLPGIIFGSLTDSGASGATGQPILNDNAAITENVNQAAFAINQILGEGMTLVRQAIDGYCKPRYLMDDDAKCAYEFMSEREQLVAVTDDDIDWGKGGIMVKLMGLTRRIFLWKDGIWNGGCPWGG